MGNGTANTPRRPGDNRYPIFKLHLGSTIEFMALSALEQRGKIADGSAMTSRPQVRRSVCT